MVKAIGVTEPGGPEALEVLDLAAEPLGPGQVRVAVRWAAVSPTDTGVRSRPRADGETGVRVPGMDVAGVVTEVGPGVDRVAVGDAVMGIVVPSGEHGAYRADVVLPAPSVTRIPDGIAETTAATLPMNGLTARLALDTLALPAGATIAVTGAAGTLGGYVVQLAKLAGLVVVADAAEQDEEFVRACGAGEILPRGGDFITAVRTAHPDGVDGLVDCALFNAAAVPAVRDGGTLATVRGYRGDGTESITVAPVFVRGYAEEAEKLDELAALAADGTLTLRVAGELPAEQAAEAHRRLEAGGTRGRFVLGFA